MWRDDDTQKTVETILVDLDVADIPVRKTPDLFLSTPQYRIGESLWHDVGKMCSRTPDPSTCTSFPLSPGEDCPTVPPSAVESP